MDRPRNLPRKAEHMNEQGLRDLANKSLLKDRRGRGLETSDAVVICDDNGRYVYANELACELFGVSSEKLLGMRIADFMPREFNFNEAWSRFLVNGTQEGEITINRPDGSERRASFRAIRDVGQGRHMSVLRPL